MAAVDGLGDEKLLYFIDTISVLIDSDDLLNLADLLASKKLVPISVQEALGHMHESVPLVTMSRYLIWSVYNTIGEVDYGIEKFLKVLSELPVGRKLAYNYYKKNHWYGRASKVVLKLKNAKLYEILKKLFHDYTNDEESPLSDSYTKMSEVVNIDERDEAYWILLEVQIPPPILTKRKCKWNKNNEVLENERCPLLCIQVSDVTPEGTYEFYVGNMRYPQAIINVHINCLMDKYKSVFVERYRRDDVTMADKDAWPKVSQTTYINLAVIKTQAVQDMNTFTCETIRGDADDIHRVKGETSYIDAFKGIKHGEFVIVEGRPGSGKTTLVHKISEDWARLVSQNALDKGKMNSLRWAHIKSLFLIHLRGYCGNPNIDLVDLVKCYYSNRQTVEIICDYITLKEGAGICFILDGLDEYQPTNRGNFIFKLIEKEILPNSIVIVASRPAAVAKYRSAKKHIEVLGFFKEQISEYIDAYGFSDNSTEFKYMLKQYLEERPNVYHMCYLPIQLAMVCFLFDKMKGTLPETETAIYEEFTKHTILRSLYRISENLECYIRSIFTLAEPEHALFRKICTLAFDKTLSSKQILEQSEVDLVCEKMNNSFGLVTIDRASTKCGFQNLYTFCHLTLQEFLAACHIFMAKEQHQRELVEISKKEKHMVVVLKFFCGLTDFKGKSILFKNVTNSEHFNCLTKIQCAFESQEATTCNYVVEGNVLSVEERFISVRDWTALGFVLINANENCVKKLSLQNSGITKEGLDAIKKAYQGNNNLEVEVLNISEIISKKHLIDFMGVFSSLCILSISGEKQYLDTMVDILNKNQHLSLKVLYFREFYKPKLIVKLDFIETVKSLVLSSFCEVKATTSTSVLVDIILNNLKNQSDYFVRELNEICSNMFSSTSVAELTLLDIHSGESILVAKNTYSDYIHQDVIDINNKIEQPSKKDSLVCYYDFISVGSYVIILCFQIKKISKYRKLFIIPQGDEFFVSFSGLIKNNVLIIDCSFVDHIKSFLEPLLLTHSISFAHRELHTLCLTNFDPQASAFPGILSQFHFCNKYLEVGSIKRFVDDLQSLNEAVEFFTNLEDIKQLRCGLSLLTSKICESLRLSSSFAHDNVGGSNSRNKDCIKVKHMILSTNIDGLHFNFICTPSLMPLNGYKIVSSNSMSYFNHSHLNLIQFKMGDKIILIIKFPFIEMIRCLLYSSLKSFKKQSRDCASILADIIVNCLDTQGAFVSELYELCSVVCETHSCVRLSLIQEHISNNIYMMCENLYYDNIEAEIKLISDNVLSSEDCTSNTSLRFSSFIPVEEFIIALYIDVTESVPKYKVYIFHKNSKLNLNFSNTNDTEEQNSEFMDRLQQFLAQKNS